MIVSPEEALKLLRTSAGDTFHSRLFYPPVPCSVNYGRYPDTMILNSYITRYEP